ncbi:MAG: hypothetical protein ACI30R_05850 [Sodaliphilus sp.]
MKKFLNISFAFLALLGILSSCSNDDIKIGNTTVVRVDPSSVLSTFTYEYKLDELTMFDKDFKLRVTVLAYNNDGLLEDKNVIYCSNYNEIATTQLDLPEGTYTVYAVTDVMNDEIEFWTMEGTETLATTKVVDQGYIGGRNKILGIATSKITVTADNTNEYSLQPEAAGALCIVFFNSVHTYSNVTKYALEMTKSCNYLQFTNDKSEGYNTAEESDNGEFGWYLGYIEPQEYTADIIYNYYFVFPMKNVQFRFTCETSDDEYYILSDPGYVSLERGGEYKFLVDLNKNVYSYGVKVNGKSNAKALAPAPNLYSPASTATAKTNSQISATADAFRQISPKSMAITDLAPSK